MLLFEFFDPPKKRKPSVQKVPLYRIYVEFYQLKLICTLQAHQNPSKTGFVEVKILFFGGFGVPGGCKSILIDKTPHISYITKLFGLMVFFFSVGRKIRKVTLFLRFFTRP